MTIHHNLMIRCRARNMQLAGAHESNGRVHTCDVVNNVVYNWREWTNIGSVNTPDTVYRVNWVGNYHQRGPATREDLTELAFQMRRGQVRIYEAGNVMNGRDPDHPNGDVYRERVRVTWRDEPWPIDPKYAVAAEDPLAAVERALRHAGPSVPYRDTLDQRYVEDMREGTGDVLDAPGATVTDSRDAMRHRGYPRLAAGTPLPDRDRDGMPDRWETRNGLDPDTRDNNGDRDDDGYTNLEEYLNGLADLSRLKDSRRTVRGHDILRVTSGARGGRRRRRTKPRWAAAGLGRIGRGDRGVTVGYLGDRASSACAGDRRRAG